jgi:hypothetical protein
MYNIKWRGRWLYISLNAMQSLPFTPSAELKLSAIYQLYQHLRARPSLAHVGNMALMKAFEDLVLSHNTSGDTLDITSFLRGLISPARCARTVGDDHILLHNVNSICRVGVFLRDVTGCEFKKTYVTRLAFDMHNVVCKVMTDAGYAWDGYLGYVVGDHPLFLSWSGATALSPATFASGVCKDMIMTTERLLIRGSKPKQILSAMVELGSETPNHYSWTKVSLMEAIIEMGLVTSGACVKEPMPDFLRDVLTLDLITGDPAHSKVPLPGFGIKYLRSDHPDMAKRKEFGAALNALRISLYAMDEYGVDGYDICDSIYN